ncbi:MAG: glucose 1-dehydrogenase [Solirubrobacteraceae bacterium]
MPNDSTPFALHPPDARLLSGRHALVTGATTGIGRGTAFELAAHGAAVAITHPGGDAARAGEAMAAEIAAAGGTALHLTLDVADEDGVRDAFATARERLGHLDLVVNNAGVEKPFALVDMPLAEWQKVIDVNLTGTFLCSREAARVMRADESKGTIVMVSSVHEVIPWERFSHYCASKGGVKLLAQSIARELAPHGIRVASVAPGAIATPINGDVLADERQRRAVEAEIPLGRWGDVADVARAIAWIASDQAAYIAGSTLFVDGGMTLYPKFV